MSFWGGSWGGRDELKRGVMVLGVEVASVESSQVAIQAEASVQEHQFSREVGDRDMGRMHTQVWVTEACTSTASS